MLTEKMKNATKRNSESVSLRSVSWPTREASTINELRLGNGADRPSSPVLKAHFHLEKKPVDVC